jgi:hypothetical protein
MKQLTAAAQKGPADKFSRYAWILDSMMDEVIDEISDADDEKIGSWFEQFGKIIEWCGTGDTESLPPSLRKYLTEAYPQEMLAIAGPAAD